MIYIYNLDMSLHILMRAESFDFIFDHAHNCLSMKRNNVVGKIVLSKKQTSLAFVQILTLTVYWLFPLSDGSCILYATVFTVISTW